MGCFSRYSLLFLYTDIGVIRLLYKRIKELRIDSDISQKQISEFLNIAQRTYSHYENGDRNIPNELLCELANYYDVSTDYLLNRTNKKGPIDK